MFVAIGFPAVVGLQERIAVAKDTLDITNELLTALRGATHGDDGVAFGVVIGYSEGFAVGLEAEGSALDEIVSSFAFARKNDFQRIGRYSFRCIFWGAGSVEK